MSEGWGGAARTPCRQRAEQAGILARALSQAHPSAVHLHGPADATGPTTGLSPGSPHSQRSLQGTAPEDPSRRPQDYLQACARFQPGVAADTSAATGSPSPRSPTKTLHLSSSELACLDWAAPGLCMSDPRAQAPAHSLPDAHTHTTCEPEAAACSLVSSGHGAPAAYAHLVAPHNTWPFAAQLLSSRWEPGVNAVPPSLWWGAHCPSRQAPYGPQFRARPLLTPQAGPTKAEVTGTW